MNFFYINTAFKETELALFSKDSLIFYKKWEAENQMKELLDAMKDIDFNKLAGVLVNIGPGRFSALRVGLSFAQTLSYSKNIPLYPFKSLEYFYALRQSFSLPGDMVFLQQVAVNEVFINGEGERFEKLPQNKLQWWGELRTPHMLPSTWEEVLVPEERDKEFFQTLMKKLKIQKSVSLEYGKEPSISLSKTN